MMVNDFFLVLDEAQPTCRRRRAGFFSRLPPDLDADESTNLGTPSFEYRWVERTEKLMVIMTNIFQN